MCKIYNWKCSTCSIFEIQAKETEDEVNFDVETKNEVKNQITNFIPEITETTEKWFF